MGKVGVGAERCRTVRSGYWERCLAGQVGAERVRFEVLSDEVTNLFHRYGRQR